MDYLLIIAGTILIISGILGCVLPVLPGPPLSYIGLLFLHFTSGHWFSSRFLIFWAAITLLVTVLDYLIPAWGAKKLGSSKRGIWGSFIGLIAGLFIFPPFGIIAGPFAGAVIGELTGGKKSGEAVKSGFGTLIGFLLGTILKLAASGLMAWHFVKELIF